MKFEVNPTIRIFSNEKNLINKYVINSISTICKC